MSDSDFVIFFENLIKLKLLMSSINLWQSFWIINKLMGSEQQTMNLVFPNFFFWFFSVWVDEKANWSKKTVFFLSGLGNLGCHLRYQIVWNNTLIIPPLMFCIWIGANEGRFDFLISTWSWSSWFSIVNPDLQIKKIWSSNLDFLI